MQARTRAACAVFTPDTASCHTEAAHAVVAARSRCGATFVPRTRAHPGPNAARQAVKAAMAGAHRT